MDFKKLLRTEKRPLPEPEAMSAFEAAPLPDWQTDDATVLEPPPPVALTREQIRAREDLTILAGSLQERRDLHNTVAVAVLGGMVQGMNVDNARTYEAMAKKKKTTTEALLAGFALDYADHFVCAQCRHWESIDQARIELDGPPDSDA